MNDGDRPWIMVIYARAIGRCASHSIPDNEPAIAFALRRSCCSPSWIALAIRIARIAIRGA